MFVGGTLEFFQVCLFVCPSTGTDLRPDKPVASFPDPTKTRTRIQQIHIPIILPPQPSNPGQPAQPAVNVVKISPPSDPSKARQPVQSVRPVVETGEAGPPGYISRVTVRRGSEDSARKSVKGFAGAPGQEFATHFLDSNL